MKMENKITNKYNKTNMKSKLRLIKKELHRY